MTRRSNGVGLLELMLALAIMAAIMAGTFFQYQRMVWGKNVAVIKASVALSQQGLNIYYYQHKGTFTKDETKIPYQEVMDQLPTSAQSTIKNPWAKSISKLYEFQIVREQLTPMSKDDDPQFIYQLQVIATLKQKATVVAGLARTLGASESSGDKVTWWRLPSQLPRPVSSDLWLLNSTMDNYTRQIEHWLGPKPAK